MSNSDLPKGWVIAKIGDVAAKAVQRAPANDDEFIYVDIGSINRDLKIISEPQKLLGKDAPSRARKVINTGDILVSLTRPNLNAVALVGCELDNQIASTGFEVIKPIIVDSRYIFSIVRSNPFIEAISGKVQGALYPAAKSDDVRGYEFFLPPLPEQQQIAAKLDELLAQVDSIKTRLDAIPKILKRFRQSVLAAAVSGKLTEDWRNETNAQQEWIPKKFGDLIVYSGNGISKRSGDHGRDITVLRLADFKNAQRIQGNERKITLTESEVGKYSLNNDDLLVIRVNGSVDIAGLFILYKGNETEAYCDHFIRFTLDLDQALPKFITYITNEGEGRRYLRHSLSTSAGQNTINQKSINALQLRIPSVIEQTEIVRRVEQLFTYADQIEQRIKDAQSRVNHLAQSILAKAFRGEFTTDWRRQNLDLISGENSAEALLAKIKTEGKSIKIQKQ